MRSRVLVLFLALPAVGAKDVLAAIPGASEPLRSYCLTHTDGVEVRGGESVLIVHHARMYPANPNNWWVIPPIDERLPLELCPSTRETRLTVPVLWQGEVQVAAAITADLAGGKRIEGRTDGSGDFSVDATQPGIYTFRSKEVEKDDRRAGRQEIHGHPALQHAGRDRRARWSGNPRPDSKCRAGSLFDRQPRSLGQH